MPPMPAQGSAKGEDALAAEGSGERTEATDRLGFYRKIHLGDRIVFEGKCIGDISTHKGYAYISFADVFGPQGDNSPSLGRSPDPRTSATAAQLARPMPWVGVIRSTNRFPKRIHSSRSSLLFSQGEYRGEVINGRANGLGVFIPYGDSSQRLLSGRFWQGRHTALSEEHDDLAWKVHKQAVRNMIQRSVYESKGYSTVNRFDPSLAIMAPAGRSPSLSSCNVSNIVLGPVATMRPQVTRLFTLRKQSDERDALVGGLAQFVELSHCKLSDLAARLDDYKASGTFNPTTTASMSRAKVHLCRTTKFPTIMFARQVTSISGHDVTNDRYVVAFNAPSLCSVEDEDDLEAILASVVEDAAPEHLFLSILNGVEVQLTGHGVGGTVALLLAQRLLAMLIERKAPPKCFARLTVVAFAPALLSPILKSGYLSPDAAKHAFVAPCRTNNSAHRENSAQQTHQQGATQITDPASSTNDEHALDAQGVVAQADKAATLTRLGIEFPLAKKTVLDAFTMPACVQGYEQELQDMYMLLKTTWLESNCISVFSKSDITPMFYGALESATEIAKFHEKLTACLYEINMSSQPVQFHFSSTVQKGRVDKLAKQIRSHMAHTMVLFSKGGQGFQLAREQGSDAVWVKLLTLTEHRHNCTISLCPPSESQRLHIHHMWRTYMSDTQGVVPSDIHAPLFLQSISSDQPGIADVCSRMAMLTDDSKLKIFLSGTHLTAATSVRVKVYIRHNSRRVAVEKVLTKDAWLDFDCGPQAQSFIEVEVQLPQGSLLDIPPEQTAEALRPKDYVDSTRPFLRVAVDTPFTIHTSSDTTMVSFSHRMLFLGTWRKHQSIYWVETFSALQMPTLLRAAVISLVLLKQIHARAQNREKQLEANYTLKRMEGGNESVIREFIERLDFAMMMVDLPAILLTFDHILQNDRFLAPTVRDDFINAILSTYPPTLQQVTLGKKEALERKALTSTSADIKPESPYEFHYLQLPNEYLAMLKHLLADYPSLLFPAVTVPYDGFDPPTRPVYKASPDRGNISASFRKAKEDARGQGKRIAASSTHDGDSDDESEDIPSHIIDIEEEIEFQRSFSAMLANVDDRLYKPSSPYLLKLLWACEPRFQSMAHALNADVPLSVRRTSVSFSRRVKEKTKLFFSSFKSGLKFRSSDEASRNASSVAQVKAQSQQRRATHCIADSGDFVRRIGFIWRLLFEDATSAVGCSPTQSPSVASHAASLEPSRTRAPTTPAAVDSSTLGSISNSSNSRGSSATMTQATSVTSGRKRSTSSSAALDCSIKRSLQTEPWDMERDIFQCFAENTLPGAGSMHFIQDRIREMISADEAAANQDDDDASSVSESRSVSDDSLTTKGIAARFQAAGIDADSSTTAFTLLTRWIAQVTTIKRPLCVDMMSHPLILVIGPQGVGKTALVKGLGFEVESAFGEHNNTKGFDSYFFKGLPVRLVDCMAFTERLADGTAVSSSLTTASTANSASHLQESEQRRGQKSRHLRGSTSSQSGNASSDVELSPAQIYAHMTSEYLSALLSTARLVIVATRDHREWNTDMNEIVSLLKHSSADVCHLKTKFDQEVKQQGFHTVISDAEQRMVRAENRRTANDKASSAPAAKRTSKKGRRSSRASLLGNGNDSKRAVPSDGHEDAQGNNSDDDDEYDDEESEVSDSDDDEEYADEYADIDSLNAEVAFQKQAISLELRSFCNEKAMYIVDQQERLQNDFPNRRVVSKYYYNEAALGVGERRDESLQSVMASVSSYPSPTAPHVWNSQTLRQFLHDVFVYKFGVDAQASADALSLPLPRLCSDMMNL